MTNNSVLICDSARGVYIPHTFANTMRGYIDSNIREVFEDMTLLEEGNPYETEGYWEAWENILWNFWYRDANGQKFVLYQSDQGDLWGVPEVEMQQIDEE